MDAPDALGFVNVMFFESARLACPPRRADSLQRLAASCLFAFTALGFICLALMPGSSANVTRARVPTKRDVRGAMNEREGRRPGDTSMVLGIYTNREMTEDMPHYCRRIYSSSAHERFRIRKDDIVGWEEKRVGDNG